MASVSTSLRKHPPSSYLLTIESFSELLKSKAETYESCVFEAGGYKWKLIFYPTGNKNDGGRDHISLYLRIEDTSSLPQNWEINVELRFFVYNLLQNAYLTVQDGSIKQFKETKKEWGFAKLLSLSTFNDPNKGYLVGESCALGVEVLVIRPYEKGETLSFDRTPENSKFTWRIHLFSKLDQPDYHSDEFVLGERTWKLAIHPKGYMEGQGDSFSLYMVPLNSRDNVVESMVYARIKLRVLDQFHSKHVQKEAVGWRPIGPPGYGATKFLRLEDLHNPSKGFVVKDTLIVEAEVNLVSVNKGPFPPGSPPIRCVVL